MSGGRGGRGCKDQQEGGGIREDRYDSRKDPEARGGGEGEGEGEGEVHMVALIII